MSLHFFQPPPAQRAGGLDAAIQSLRGALEQVGIPVDDEFPDDDGGQHVVHFHGLWQPAHARVARACAARKIPFVVSPHGMLEPWAWRHKWWKKWPYFQMVEARYLRAANVILATCDAEARRIREKLPGSVVEVVPLGLTSDARPNHDAARAALGWASGERVLLFLSRLHEKKGLDLLLRALVETRWSAQTRLVIVGGGEPRYVKKLQSLAESGKSRLPRIEWTGEIWGEKRWPYFQGADLFCLPSHSENFGLAVLEACQVGTPALTTRATPWGEWLADGRGYVCDATVDSIQESLARFLSERIAAAGQREKLAEWTRAEFSWGTLAPRYAEVYRAAIQPR